MYKFSLYTLDILYKNGWHEQPQVDVNNYNIFFVKTYQPVSDIILDFLRLFGDLELKYPNKIAPTIISICQFNPIEAFDTISSDSIKQYRDNWIIEDFCVIGLFEQETLIMTVSGVVYSLFDSYVFRIGNSGYEAIENMINFIGGERIVKYTPD